MVFLLAIQINKIDINFEVLFFYIKSRDWVIPLLTYFSLQTIRLDGDHRRIEWPINRNKKDESHREVLIALNDQKQTKI